MMFRWANKQPGIEKFSELCGHYQDIYYWISLNKPPGLILTQQSMGSNEKEIRWLVYFHFFEALNRAFEVQFFQGFILHLIKDTDSM